MNKFFGEMWILQIFQYSVKLIYIATIIDNYRINDYVITVKDEIQFWKILFLIKKARRILRFKVKKMCTYWINMN